MDRTSGLPTALALTRTPSTLDSSPPRGSPPPRSDHDRDRLARKMNDVVVRRIFAAGLDLQGALGLLGDRGMAGDHLAASKIWHATDELDRAIRDLRDILFEPW